MASPFAWRKAWEAVKKSSYGHVGATAMACPYGSVVTVSAAFFNAGGGSGVEHSHVSATWAVVLITIDPEPECERSGVVSSLCALAGQADFCGFAAGRRLGDCLGQAGFTAPRVKLAQLAFDLVLQMTFVADDLIEIFVRQH